MDLVCVAIAAGGWRGFGDLDNARGLRVQHEVDGMVDITM